MGLTSSKLSKIIGAQGVKRLVGGERELITPKGYFPIQVGINEDKTKRFVVHRAALGDADFLALLHKSVEEYGFCNEGVLRIPYEAKAFEEWMVTRATAKTKSFKEEKKMKKIWVTGWLVI